MRAVAATFSAAVAEARANRGALWSQIVAMIVNDCAWVAFWLLFFDGVGSVRGWDTSRVLLLFAVLTTSAGLVLGLLSNARSVGRMASNGELDAALALPVPPLSHLLVRRIDAVNVGDMVFGIGLFFVTGSPSLERTLLYVLGVLTGSLLLAGFLVAAGSLAFFGGKGEAGDFGLHAILLMASYPADVFTGMTKTLLYTLVPAALVAAAPASLVADFDLSRGLGLLGAAIGFALLGWTVFTLGLRRYSSGSVWTRA